jgi:hypothetical protein
MFQEAFKNIDDVLRKEAGCTTELDYTEQSSWLLFLKYLDGLEADKATEAALDGKKDTYILDKPYRWETWAAPKDKSGKLANVWRRPCGVRCEGSPASLITRLKTLRTRCSSSGVPSSVQNTHRGRSFQPRLRVSALRSI